MDSHWLSFNTYDGPQGTPGGNGCIISVVLEDDAKLFFSGVRLLIVYTPEGRLEDLELVECLDCTRFKIPAESGSSYRKVLTRRASATHHGNKLITDTLQSVCNVVFELVDSGNTRYFIYELIPRSQLTLKRNDLRVAFDHTYPCTSDDPPVRVLLNTSHSFRPIAILGTDIHGPTIDKSRIITHAVRVLPVSRRSLHLPQLPPHILLCIVKLALADKSTGWRRRLLPYGLVCKSWAHVLDLALGGFDDVVEYDHPGVIPVARVLDARPERAAAIRIFDPSLFEYNIEPSAIGKWDAVLNILSHATSAEIVRLSYIDPSFAQSFLRLFQKLTKVRVCKMNFPHPSNRFFRRSKLAMGDVLKAIVGWEYLETLEIVHLNGDGLIDAHSQLQMKSNLRLLRLQTTSLCGSQLMSFALSPAPCLKEVNLNDVRELLNRDVFDFLTAVSPTLSYLIVLGCAFKRDAGEEHAIDAAMPAMTALETLSVDGYCASSLSLSRKTNNPPGESINCHVSFRPADLGVTLADAAEAIRVTAWSSISLLWTQIWGWDEKVAEGAKRTAAGRGINLECRVTRSRGGRGGFPLSSQVS